MLMEEEPNGFSEKWGVLIELDKHVENRDFELTNIKTMIKN